MEIVQRVLIMITRRLAVAAAAAKADDDDEFNRQSISMDCRLIPSGTGIRGRIFTYVHWIPLCARGRSHARARPELIIFLINLN